MALDLIQRDAVAGVLGEQSSQQILQTWIHIKVSRKCQRLRGYCIKQLELCCCNEWTLAKNKAVKRHSQSPHINCFRNVRLLCMRSGLITSTAQLRSEKSRSACSFCQFSVDSIQFLVRWMQCDAGAC